MDVQWRPQVDTEPVSADSGLIRKEFHWLVRHSFIIGEGLYD